MTAPTLGRLDLVPATSATHLLAPPVADGVAGQEDAWVCEIDPGLADTAEFGEAFDVPPEASANCVVVLGRRGDDETLAACMVLADSRLDVNKAVRKHLDVRKCSFAPMDRATSETRMEYGGITPVGVPAAWPVLVDERVAAQPWVVVGSGLRRSKLVLPGAVVASLPGAVVGVFATPPSAI
ncbi:YbaK/EbsC family protein [Solicola sp. PLA-1-18]|uniref:YbaK/EbsC family protein n=1 Tax=Solicola sp. PLA-1-18 TaxID=3380532 RepID=UPI003B792AB5